jgi:hypothetical protein
MDPELRSGLTLLLTKFGINAVLRELRMYAMKRAYVARQSIPKNNNHYWDKLVKALTPMIKIKDGVDENG